MNKIKDNKKLFAIIVIISLIAVLLGSYAIYKNSNKTETADKIEKTEKLEKKAEKKLKEAKKSGDKEEIAKAEKELKEAEAKTEEVKKTASSTSASSSSANTNKSKPTASKPSASSSSGTTSTKPKEKTKVWIVDKPAWVENRVTPIFSKGKTVYVAVDGETGKETEWDSYDEAMSDKGMPSGYGNVYDYIKGEELIGYDTKEINHPEEGHWEYR